MADIPGDTGEGLDIRYLTSGTDGDIVGIYPSGLFAGSFALTNIGSVSIHSSNRLGVSGIVEVSGIVHDFTTMYTQLTDYESGFQAVYIGLAPPGTGSEVANWMLRKYLYGANDLPIATLFGSGNTNFDKKWSERSGIHAEYS